jgi:hypothetical protein
LVDETPVLDVTLAMSDNECAHQRSHLVHLFNLRWNGYLDHFRV